MIVLSALAPGWLGTGNIGRFLESTDMLEMGMERPFLGKYSSVKALLHLFSNFNGRHHQLYIVERQSKLDIATFSPRRNSSFLSTMTPPRNDIKKPFGYIKHSRNCLDMTRGSAQTDSVLPAVVPLEFAAK